MPEPPHLTPADDRSLPELLDEYRHAVRELRTHVDGVRAALDGAAGSLEDGRRYVRTARERIARAGTRRDDA